MKAWEDLEGLATTSSLLSEMLHYGRFILENERDLPWGMLYVLRTVMKETAAVVQTHKERREKEFSDD